MTGLSELSTDDLKKVAQKVIPIVAPKNWLAPKRLAADIPTKIGMKINGAADTKFPSS